MGYVHRDLKPENVVLNLDPLDVRVIDFERVRLDS
jgi:serine/threonine protein kinase